MGPSVPSSMLTSVPSSSLLMSSRSVRSSPCTYLRNMDFKSLVWETNVRWAPMRESEGAALSEDENASSGGSREGNVCNDALHVIGLCGRGHKISLF